MGVSLLVAVAAVVLAPLIAYIGAVRRLSGRIGTSEASSLWAESKAIRDDYRDQIAAMRKVIDRCQERLEFQGDQIAALERNNSDLNSENRRLRIVVEEHELRIAGLREENTNLRAENAKLKVRVAELEAAA